MSESKSIKISPKIILGLSLAFSATAVYIGYRGIMRRRLKTEIIQILNNAGGTQQPTMVSQVTSNLEGKTVKELQLLKTFLNGIIGGLNAGYTDEQWNAYFSQLSEQQWTIIQMVYGQNVLPFFGINA